RDRKRRRGGQPVRPELAAAGRPRRPAPADRTRRALGPRACRQPGAAPRVADPGAAMSHLARRMTARIAAAALGGLTIVWACLRKREVRYYTLAGAAPAGPGRHAAAGYTVHVAAASVPAALNRPELVLRISATEVAVDDNHRWAEPLRTGIARAVADGLAR